MPDLSAHRNPQTIRDAKQPVYGEQGSRATFFLRSTPPVFTVISAANSNQDFQLRAHQAVETVQRQLLSRLYRPPFPASVIPAAVTFDMVLDYAVEGIGTDKSTISYDLTLDYVTRAASTETTTGGLYASLIEADRPIGWWGFDETAVEDESGHGYTLTATGTPVSAGTLLTHGNEVNSASRDFNGTTDAYSTAGTLYQDPDVPPQYHSATADAGINEFSSITSPAGVEAGDLMLAVHVHELQTATISSAPSGWTQIGTTLNAGTCAVALYKRLPVVDEPPDEYIWTWSTAGTTLSTILVYRNCDPAVAGLIFDSGSQVTASSGFHTTTTETNPMQAHALAIWAGDFTGTITPDSTGVTSRVAISTGAIKITAAEYDVAAAGTVTKTATTSASAQLASFFLTFGAPDEVLEDALDAVAENISLHVLIRPDTVAAGTRTIIRKHQSWGLYLNGAVVTFAYRDGGGVDRTVTGPSVSASTVTHLVVTDDGSLIHFYKDGVETTSARLGSAGYTTNANQVTIGAYNNGAYTNFFDGRIDEPAVFAACVSDQMVAAWYQAHNLGTFGTQILGTAGVGRLPRVKLEMAFVSSPTDPTLVWEDVTADIRPNEQITVNRGRNFELDRIETGHMDYTLSNRSRQYDDTYASSPYYPNVKPTRPVRLRAQATTDGTAYSVFFGYTEGHPLLRVDYGHDAVARFTATDAFKSLSMDKVQGTLVRPQELSGERLQALLDGFPGVPYVGDSGQSEIIGNDLDGVNSLDHALQVAETEGGVLFSDTAGKVLFQDRHHRSVNEREVRVTYSDADASSYPIKHMEPLVDEARLFTAATVTPASGNTQRAIDIESSVQHFVRTKEMTTIHALDNDALAMANAYAIRYSVPRTRIPQIVLQPAAAPDPEVMWATVLGHEISHRIGTDERPLGDTSTVSREHFIEGINHSIGLADWIVSLSVSPAELEGEYLIIGTGVVGDDGGSTSGVIGW